MPLHDDILAQTNGALFRRADLHIHSYGQHGSYDVTDVAMTPEAIIDTAIVEGLQVIAITDHNSIGNVRRGQDQAVGKRILVVPGVELSTTHGHLLVYCPSVEALEVFFGKLQISSDRKSCHNTIAQCLAMAHEVGGFGIAAHVDRDGGLESAHPKYDAFKHEIFSTKNLLGIEITDITNGDWFAHADGNADRRNCAVVRCRSLGQDEEVDLAKVMASDAHSLGALGRNARGAKKLTRLKMESLTFDALRVALLDCAARVRLEDLIPQAVPHFVGMLLEGGFLNGQTVHFSRNLTCIIGGRGAGKSTLLESLRVGSGNQVTNDLVDSEVWPDAISLVYQDEVGQTQVFSRSKLNQVVNATNPTNGMTQVPIESYGQGETAATIQHCDKDPVILLRFLDEFIDDEGIPAKDEYIRNNLLQNQTELERLSLEINRIPDIERAKATADQQVETLKKQNAGQLVELEQKLATERRFRQHLSDRLGSLLETMNDSLTSEPVKELVAELETASLAVGKVECDQVKSLLTGLSAKIDELAGSLKGEVRASTTAITAKLTEWNAKERDTQAEIERIRRQLEAQKIKLDIAFIRKVTKDVTDYAVQLQELRKLIPKKQEALTRRRELLRERRALKGRLCTIRQSFATVMNRNLASTVVDYSVTIRFHEGKLSSEFEELIKGAMDWRTSQVPKAALMARNVSPVALLDMIIHKNTAPLEAIVNNEGGRVFGRTDASRILETLGYWKNRAAIERCVFEDMPEIRVTGTITREDGSKAYPAKDFSKLSLGQQQSILLSILLFSKSTAPLIIDQPEDNLDSEFIYKTLVRCLRSVKEQRQVIIVTHNANIAVLGDAELIIPLRGASEHAVIRDPGSIDNPSTKNIVCTILEGSKRAFVRRHQVYGF